MDYVYEACTHTIHAAARDAPQPQPHRAHAPRWGVEHAASSGAGAPARAEDTARLIFASSTHMRISRDI